MDIGADVPPGGGLVFYFFFRPAAKGGVIGKKSYKPSAEEADGRISAQIPVRFRQITAALSLFRNTNQGFSFRWKPEVYTRGLSMIQLAARIAKGDRHIHMEFYIFEDDAIGRMVRDVLMEKAKQEWKCDL